MRVHELAKELGIASKELLGKLCELDIKAGNHMSALDEAAVLLVRQKYGSDAEKAEPAPPLSPAEALPSKPAEREAIAEKPKTRKTVSRPVHRTTAARTAPDISETGSVIKVHGSVIVKEFAERIGVRPNRLVAELMGMNILASINERIEVNVARKIAEKHGFTLEHEKKQAEYRQDRSAIERETEEEEDKPEDLLPRPPVAAFLGHVDHGKTSLLDKIRDTAVVKEEYGGITQHIGAYTVDVGGRSITFIDTPGHAAFTAMRARGANLTDIALIVIAADDGIMPQTKEAIMHARAANVALIVVINKMDLPAANIDRVKQQLQADELTPEDWGGEIICCPVSAQTGEGIDHLLEMILLQAEIMEIKANPNRRAKGYVIEAQLEPGMGPTANILVAKGTLNVGDSILCGPYCGKVKALINDHGVKVKSAPPATPVKCLGLSGVPEAGEKFTVHGDDKITRSLANKAMEELKNEQITVPKRASLDDLFDQMKEDKKLELNVILKADTQGSVEAVSHALKDIKSSKISLNFILCGTGNLTANDVMLASASNAVILGFNVAREPGVDSAARHEGIDIRLYNIIYELIDQVRDAMMGLLPPEIIKKNIGKARIKQTFMIGKKGKIAGCIVTDGSVTPKLKVIVKRNDEMLYEGAINSLKQLQKSVSEVREGQECGIRLDNFMGFDEDDVLEFYEVEEVKQTL